MIAVISYFDSNLEPLNCESVVAENTATSRDGFYFVPLNKDDVPLGTQIILKEELNKIGVYKIDLNFHSDVKANISLKISKIQNK